MTILTEEAKKRGWLETLPDHLPGWFWTARPGLDYVYAHYICPGQEFLYKDHVFLPIEVPDMPEFDHEKPKDNPKPETSSPPRLKCPMFPGCGPCERYKCKHFLWVPHDKKRGHVKKKGHYCTKKSKTNPTKLD